MNFLEEIVLDVRGNGISDIESDLDGYNIVNIEDYFEGIKDNILIRFNIARIWEKSLWFKYLRRCGY